MTSEVRNLEFARRLKRFSLLSLGLAVVGACGVVLGADVVWIFIGPYFVAFHATYAWALPRLFGSIAAQKYICADTAGLHYGPKYHVPWDHIQGAKTSKPLFGNERSSLLVSEWGGLGISNWAVRRHGLPLSQYDRNWRTNANFVALLRDNLPRDAVRSLEL